MSSATHVKFPTSPQLHFLRSLAEQTGTTFIPPETREHASSEIERLLALKESGYVERAVRSSDVDAEPEPIDTGPVYATGVQPGEVVGFGSAASWRKAAPEQAASAAAEPQVGQLTELDRYSVSGGERVLYGQRIKGSVRITDRPAAGAGRAYLVERELEQDGYSALKALVADYTSQARDLDAIPMANSIVCRELQQAAA
ncbi:MAG TPA: hypothetical protein VNV42_08410 [Solirubrobacteraceae bacterium]|nr:hypothetical protein [Solirubrobacteraceae bacterium]